MDPINFQEIRTKGLPNTAMKDLSKCLLTFDVRATVDNLQVAGRADKPGNTVGEIENVHFGWVQHQRQESGS